MLTTADIMWPDGESSNMDPSLRILCTLSELYDRELVAAIGWAKQIPGEYSIKIKEFGFVTEATWTEWVRPSGMNPSLPNPIPLCQDSPFF